MLIVIIDRTRLLTIVFGQKVALIITKLGFTLKKEISAYTLVHFYL